MDEPRSDGVDRATGRFPETRWTLVARAGGVAGGSGDSAGQRQALVEWLTRYVPALRAHLVAHKGIAPARADDLLQEFLANKVLRDGLIAEARPERGRFRTFLLTVLDRFMASEHRKERAKKRSADASVLLDEGADVPDAASTRSDRFDVEWARALLSQALATMERECQSTGRPDVWGVFETRILKPMLEHAEPLPYAQLVERYGLRSPAQASNVLMTGKRTFARILRGLIAEYEPDESRVDEEIADLHEVFARAGRAST